MRAGGARIAVDARPYPVTPPSPAPSRSRMRAVITPIPGSVVPAAGEDDVGVALGGLHELVVHRAHRGEVLLDHRVDGAAAQLQVALEAADEAHVGLGVDEDLQVEEVAELRLDEEEDALDEHHVARLDPDVSPVRVWAEKS